MSTKRRYVTIPGPSAGRFYRLSEHERAALLGALHTAAEQYAKDATALDLAGRAPEPAPGTFALVTPRGARDLAQTMRAQARDARDLADLIEQAPDLLTAQPEDEAEAEGVTP